jgi:hypothetical protein
MIRSVPASTTALRICNVEFYVSGKIQNELLSPFFCQPVYFSFSAWFASLSACVICVGDEGRRNGHSVDLSTYQLERISVDRNRLEHGQQPNPWIDVCERIVGDSERLRKACTADDEISTCIVAANR